MDIEIKKIIGSTDSGTPDTGKSAKEKINGNFASLLEAIKNISFSGEDIDDLDFSKLKNVPDFLLPTVSETIKELYTFLKGLIADSIKSSNYTAGAFGSGMRMWMQDGQSHAEIDNLHVRMEAIFNKLTIAELQSVGGQVVLSVADLQCVKVTEYDAYYRCYFDTKDGTIPNRWAINDQARCQAWTGTRQKYYWRLVVSVGANYIDLSKIDCNGSGVPEARDAIVQLGNRTDLARQNAIVLSAYGVDAPSITQYEGIHSYTTDGCEVTVISPKGNKFTGDLRVKSGNKIIPIPADKGAFVSGETYRYYDRVSHNGALWLCVIAEGKTTTSAPPSEAWLKQVDKGANGKPGTDGKDGKDAGVNLLKWQEEWKEGSLPAGWERNGSIEENSLIYGENPFKVRSLMWKCTPDVNGEAAGGYLTPPMILDEKYAHRFSTFVFRVRTGNGGVYHGCYGLDDLSDTENGNPYFWSGDLPATEWFLMVGYIHPKGSVVSKSLSGVYNMKGEKIIEGADYKFRKPNVEIRPRNYLYYSNMPAGEVYFYNPMLHKLDGTEPSIEQMLQLSARKEIDAAKATSEAYAAAQAELARVKAEANADGKITAAEARAIADATNKADAARDAAIAAASADTSAKIEAVKTTYDKKFESTDKQFLSVLTETKTYADNAVKNVQIGGANLFLDSAAERAAGRHMLLNVFDIFADHIGKNVVVSFDIKVRIPRYIAVYPYQGTGLSVLDSSGIDATTTYKRFSYTTKVVERPIVNNYSRGQISLYDSAGDNNITIKNIKIEFGTVATPYSPAPREIKKYGANLLKNSAKEVTSNNEYTAINILEIAKANLGQQVMISFDIKTNKPGAVGVYALGKYEINTAYTAVTTTEYTRHYMPVGIFTYNPNGDGGFFCNLSFYGQYGSGLISTVRNVQIELGTEASAYMPSPDDADAKFTALEQTAKSWNLSVNERVNGQDRVLASYGLTAAGALIKGDKIELDGNVIAKAIKTGGLNVGDKTFINELGEFRTVNATISGSISMPFKRVTYQLGTSYVPDLSDIYNLVVYATPSANAADNWIVIRLPDASLYNGRVFNIFNNTTYIEGRTPINLTVIANPPNYPYNKIRVIGYGELVTFTSVGDGWFFHNQYREVIN